MSVKLTPMMQQYLDVKGRHPDKFVFFRMGDFYEMFFDDAKRAAGILGIALTARNKGEDAVPMAGVPHHAVETYLKKLVGEGHRVVICDQVEDPSEAVGLVKREVTRIITPGTYYSEKSDDVRANVFLAAVRLNGTAGGIAIADLSTGEFFAEQLPCKDAVEELAKMGISECLVAEDDEDGFRVMAAEMGTERVTRVPAWNFEREAALSLLREHFKIAALDGFGFDEDDDVLCLTAAGAVLRYLQETQKHDLVNFIKLTPLTRDDIVHIDRASQGSLELVRSQRTGDRAGSLFSVLDHTRTAMGGRRLQQFILRPVTVCREIFMRQEAVRELKENDFLREEVRELIGGIYDLERLASRLSSKRCSARDLVHLKNSLACTTLAAESLAGVFSRRLIDVRDRLQLDGHVVRIISERIVDDPPLQLSESGIIRDGVSADLDEIRAISRDGKSWIADYQAKERSRSGIDKLKVGYNKVFGYYLEVTNVNRDKVPADYIRKQTLANAERFITPELKEYEGKVLSAEDRIRKLEGDIFAATRDEAAGRIAEILQAAAAVAELDVYQSLAAAAVRYRYIAPVVDDSTAIEIVGGSHPVLLAAMPEGQFVPNDLFIDAQKEQFLIITGPNMAGKSTYIRQAAILVLMAQIGSFVPAQKATIGVVDKIFTRIGASDEISRGQSTFMVEMTEVANILNNATERSFVILDEVGRGTSTFDGVSIAWAIAEYLMNRIRARTLFATHYHELTELVLTSGRARNLNVAVKEWNDTVVFLHKIIEGAADKSYGIHVADIAGLPDAVTARAREVLANLENSSLGDGNVPRLAETRQPEPEPVQMSIFDMNNDRVVRRLRELDVNGLTPIQALNILNELKEATG